MKRAHRVEKDLLGEVEIPIEAYWGINTQRAVENFRISGRRMPKQFIQALAKVKKACLMANVGSGRIDQEMGRAIMQALDEILEEKITLVQFPVDIFQTGSGTQTNMNINEVVANRANEILGFPLGKKEPVHPNDHVNQGQSSNDVIPTAMHLSAVEALETKLIPSLEEMIQVLNDRIQRFDGIIKVGRTHLQDAVPIPLSMEFNVYRTELLDTINHIRAAQEELKVLSIGGTALGTGINAPEGFAEEVISNLSKMTKTQFRVNPIKAQGIATHNAIVRLSGVLRSLALSLLKMANDIRWMASGPRAGLGELKLPMNELGSSIMPGKINPTQSEALIQVTIRVMGNDETLKLAEALGSILDLNVTKPLMAWTVLESIQLLGAGIYSFSKNCLKGLEADEEKIKEQLDQSLMLVTRLSPIIGYDKASEIAQKALKERKTIRQVVADMGLKIDDLESILDPKKMV